MKNMSIVKFTFIVLLMSFNVSAFDVIPKKLKEGSLYVRVSVLPRNYIKFEKCLYLKENESCQPIGGKPSYKLSRLVDQRQVEQLQIAGAISADVAIAGAFYFLGGIAGSAVNFGFAVVSGIETGSSVLMWTGRIIGLSLIPGSFLSIPDEVNPIEQYEQSAVLRNNILMDQKVIEKDINNFINRLQLVLNKLDN